MFLNGKLGGGGEGRCSLMEDWGWGGGVDAP